MTLCKCTVLGGSGFVGRHLASYLEASGLPYWVPERGSEAIFERPLGTVFYCIGLTADFRERPLAAIDAHVGVLQQLLLRADFEKLIYLSSTRVYSGAAIAEEGEVLRVSSDRPDDLYNLSKLMGESALLASGRPGHVVRLSNVLGPDMGAVNFVGAVVAEACREGRVNFRTALDSAKDYIWIDDVVAGLVAIADKGRAPIYNLAGGYNLSHVELARLLVDRGVEVTVADGAPSVVFPEIAVSRLAADTGFVPMSLLPRLTAWLDTLLCPVEGAVASTGPMITRRDA